jgi:hypothetical protein
MLKNNPGKIKNIITAMLICFLAIMLKPALVLANAGLSSSWGEVIFRDLSIGQTYSTRQLLNLPLTLTNTGGLEMDIQVEIIAPTQGSLKEGYEVIPSTSWIHLAQDYFTIAPNEKAVTDVVISIPDDPKYLGKKYQFQFYSHNATSIGFLGIGVSSRVLLEISAIKPDLSQEQISALRANLNFSINPPNLGTPVIKLGQNYNLEKLTGKTFKIVNPNDEAYAYKVTSVDPKQLGITPAIKDYEVCPDASFVKIGNPNIKVSGNSIEKIKISINIPNKEEYKNKKYMFVIYTDVLNQDIPVGKYNLLYVNTGE